MKASDLHKTIRAALGTHEGFRRLGFRPDDIYVHQNPDSMVLVVLKTQEKQFAISVGTLPGPDFEKQWLEAAHAVVNGDLDEESLQQCWQESLPCRHKLEFVAAIHAKGIRLPVDRPQQSQQVQN